MDNFKDYIISFIMIGAIVICFLGFATGVGNNYGKTNMVNSADLNLTPLQNQINKTANDAHNWEKIFNSDNLFVVAGGIILYSIWTILTSMWIGTFNFYNIYLQIINNLLGIPPIVTGIFTPILIITLIFLGWRVIKQGQ